MMSKYLPLIAAYVRHDWKLLAMRLPVYAVGMYVIFQIATSFDSKVVQTVIGGLLACMLFASELALTARIKGISIQQAATARFLLIDYFAAGEQDAVVTRIRERDMLTFDRPAPMLGAGDTDLQDGPFESADPFDDRDASSDAARRVR
jgi:hypothetical protein